VKPRKKKSMKNRPIPASAAAKKNQVGQPKSRINLKNCKALPYIQVRRNLYYHQLGGTYIAIDYEKCHIDATRAVVAPYSQVHRLNSTAHTLGPYSPIATPPHGSNHRVHQRRTSDTKKYQVLYFQLRNIYFAKVYFGLYYLRIDFCAVIYLQIETKLRLLCSVDRARHSALVLLGGLPTKDQYIRMLTRRGLAISTAFSSSTTPARRCTT
jgi:hypothetical protein